MSIANVRQRTSNGHFALEIYDDDGEGLDSCLGGDEFLLRRK